MLMSPVTSAENSPSQTQKLQTLHPYLNIHIFPPKLTKTPSPDPDALAGGRVGGRRAKGQTVQNRCSQETPEYLVASVWEIQKGRAPVGTYTLSGGT